MSKLKLIKSLFATWCLFQHTAIKMGVWKPRFLFHNLSILKYLVVKSAQDSLVTHEYMSNHHIVWLHVSNHYMEKFDIDSYIVDTECACLEYELPAKSVVDYISSLYRDARKQWWENGNAFNENRYKELYVYAKAMQRLRDLHMDD